MPKPGLRTIFSVAALAAAVFLSLADSADPPHVCAPSTLEKTFDVTTTCGGQHSGRVHVMWSGTDSSLVSLTTGQWKLLSGDLRITNIAIEPTCNADQPAIFQGLDFTFETADDGPSEPAVCYVTIGNYGTVHDCAAASPCTVTMTEAQVP
jgi:hypothetical protein